MMFDCQEKSSNQTMSQEFILMLRGNVCWLDNIKFVLLLRFDGILTSRKYVNVGFYEMAQLMNGYAAVRTVSHIHHFCYQLLYLL